MAGTGAADTCSMPSRAACRHRRPLSRWPEGSSIPSRPGRIRGTSRSSLWTPPWRFAVTGRPGANGTGQNHSPACPLDWVRRRTAKPPSGPPRPPSPYGLRSRRGAEHAGQQRPRPV